ncbi:D-alanyl-D-alanine carboxypeptidase/D-alanyl-D-alanine-endopeptidase [uncultured Thiohalocapsa sp.]|uniref:D-alanyl-D-alanine carboxypeptidase/D-alanyl-D-alanine-endopeptidase n=1 Tax=uncultured Thiohalocapsa sp. TaxID=768990 RepID=UPI0025FE9E22|nr:D-alanyl-D-alanine carboxypeptidase [uncultured Thiohalocapsa sp.]
MSDSTFRRCGAASPGRRRMGVHPGAPPARPRAAGWVPLWIGLLLMLWAACAAADPIGQALALGNASLVVEEGGRTVIADNADRGMVPASTMKLLTALAAIERWGLSHRFTTQFRRGGDGRLWVVGQGDPYLVSEELDQAVRALRRQGVSSVSGIGLDDTLFAAGDRIPGRSSSHNPYDAPVTALAVNFNTVNVVVSGGRVSTAETQTQLTRTAQRMGAAMGAGKHRINLRTRDNALSHFGELLSAKLKAAGIRVNGGVTVGRVPAGATLLLTHRNSRPLSTVVENMLEYSTNFVANDLFLLLGERGGRSSMAQSQRALEDWARRKFGWRDFVIEDGAGLSRGNRLSGRQLIDVLDAMAPYRNLVPAQDGNPNVRAKTGTLRGVSCYAGWVRRNAGWTPFSLLINQPVSYGFRNQVASALATAPTLARY